MTTIFVPKQAPMFNSLGYDNLKVSGYSIPAFDYGLKLKNFKFKKFFFSTSSLTLQEIKKTVKNLNKMGIEYYMLHVPVSIQLLYLNLTYRILVTLRMS